MTHDSTESLGNKASLNVRFTIEQATLFAQLSGDLNPIHFDEAFAKNSIFGRPIVPGMLVSSTFSGIIAQQLPGPGSIYLSQSLKFLHPIFFDEDVQCTVTELDRPIPSRFLLGTQVLNANGKLCIDGEALIKNDSAR